MPPRTTRRYLSDRQADDGQVRMQEEGWVEVRREKVPGNRTGRAEYPPHLQAAAYNEWEPSSPFRLMFAVGRLPIALWERLRPPSVVRVEYRRADEDQP